MAETQPKPPVTQSVEERLEYLEKQVSQIQGFMYNASGLPDRVNDLDRRLTAVEGK